MVIRHQATRMLWFILTVAFVNLAAGQERLSLIVLGDWGTGSSAQGRVAAAMESWAQQYRPQFILTTGDNFYNEGITGPDDPRWEDYWRSVYTGTNIRNLKWEVSVGNHDYYPRFSQYEWNQVDYTQQDPERRWNLPALHHSFYRNSSLGRIHFIAIDTQGLRRRQNDHEQQLQWLEDTLAQSDGVMKIAFGHHPIWSTGRYGPGSSTIQREILPRLQAGNVDMYLCGHDHNMQFMSPVDTSDYLEFWLSAGGGRGLYDERPEYRDILLAAGVQVEYFYYGHGFMTILAENGASELTIEIRDEDNAILRRWTKAPRQQARREL